MSNLGHSPGSVLGGVDGLAETDRTFARYRSPNFTPDSRQVKPPMPIENGSHARAKSLRLSQHEVIMLSRLLATLYNQSTVDSQLLTSAGRPWERDPI